jgi:hypothetical protein
MSYIVQIILIYFAWFVSFALIILSILCQTMAFTSSIHNILDSIWLKFLYPLESFPKHHYYALQCPNLLKLQTCFRLPRDTILYSLPHLVSWDLNSPYEICVIIVYSMLVSLQLLSPHDNGQYHICCPVWSNINNTWMPPPVYLSECGPPDCGFSHQETSKQIYEYYNAGTLYSWLLVFRCGNLTPSSLLISYKLSFPTVSLKMSSLHTLVLKSINEMFIQYLGDL